MMMLKDGGGGGGDDAEGWCCLPQTDHLASLVAEVSTSRSAVLFCFCWLVAYRPSNMRVYLRDGSAQTILRAATLR